MKITLEFDTVEELGALCDLRDRERDELKSRVQQLQSEPLKFSLAALANKVADGVVSLTPDQKEKVHTLIEG